LSAVLLVASLFGVLGGAFLIGRWALGAAIVADSVAGGVWALYRNDGQDEQPQAHEVQPTTLAGILEKARRSA
jgi:hypothetical protein